MQPLYSKTSIEDALHMYYLIQNEMSDHFRGFTHASVRANLELFMIKVIQLQFKLLLGAIFGFWVQVLGAKLLH